MWSWGKLIRALDLYSLFLTNIAPLRNRFFLANSCAIKVVPLFSVIPCDAELFDESPKLAVTLRVFTFFSGFD